MIPKLLLFFSCTIAVATDMMFVWWAKHPSHPLYMLIIGVIANLVGLFTWAYSMYKGVESAMAITVYSLLTVIGCSSLGIFFFKEPFSITNAIGLMLALVALVLISL